MSPAASSLACRLVIVVLATAMTLTLLPLLAKPASATAQYNPGGFGCQRGTFGREVQAYRPQMTSSTGARQMVYWSPDLYRWNGVRWALYDGTRPWNHAVANNNGVLYNSIYGGTWMTPANNALNHVVFNNLPAGSYKIADYYRWGATSYYRPASYLASASAWSPFVRGGSYCHFGS